MLASRPTVVNHWTERVYSRMPNSHQSRLSSLRRHLRRGLLAAAALTLAVLLLPACAALFINAVGLQRLIPSNTPVRLEGRIDRLGWRKARASGLTASHDGTALLHLGHLQAGYTPGSLLQKQLRSLSLQGIAYAGQQPLPCRLDAHGLQWTPDGPTGTALLSVNSPRGPFSLLAKAPGRTEGTPIVWTFAEAGGADELVRSYTGFSLTSSPHPALVADLTLASPPTMTVSLGPVSAARPSLSIDELGLELQLSLPPQLGDGGRIRFERAHIASLSAGPAALPIQVTASNIVVAGQIPLGTGTPTATLLSRVTVSPALSSHTTVTIPLGTRDAALDLSDLLPSLPPLALSGLFSARVRTGPDVRDDARLDLQLRSLSCSPLNLSASNIHTRCSFALDAIPRSDPRQQARIAELHIGASRFSNVHATYQVEPPATLFIEDLTADWCGGHLAVHTLRLLPSLKDLTVKLDCRQLELEPLLAQLGAVDVTGSGQFSGSAELHVQNRHIVVRHGFLYTTPGIPGRLALHDTQQVAAMLQGRTAAQGVQIAMMTAALKDFTYDWITLNLQSEDELLHVRTSIAGRPTRPIPFVFDTALGHYTPSSKHTTQRAMQLNLNFAVPLNQLLDYAYGVSGKINLKRNR